MMTVVPMTHDEKVAAYMKMKKLEIAEMLARASAALEVMGPQVSYPHEGPSYYPTVTTSAGA